MKCVICKKKIMTTSYGWSRGHNPAPVAVEGRCCEQCNTTIVIPMRIGLIVDDNKQDK
tara:strand:- start:511 stop:684 length:174 start_codon:yes stop_codon:yes gene_type:complete